MRSVNWDRFLDLMINATLETLYMVALATLFTVAIGLPVGVLLFITRKDGVLPSRAVAVVLNSLVNIGRALPFVIFAHCPYPGHPVDCRHHAWQYRRCGTHYAWCLSLFRSHC